MDSDKKKICEPKSLTCVNLLDGRRRLLTTRSQDLGYKINYFYKSTNSKWLTVPCSRVVDFNNSENLLKIQSAMFTVGSYR